jgi:ABC-type transport system involved in multi-copper enzyme maturation permease subunit
MVTQTLAIFVDAYRELNSRKIFWIVLILSTLVMLAFAGFSATDEKITYFGINFPNFGFPPRALYKSIFTGFIVGVWLTWAATGLALFSTASIFPDLVSGGSIDLYLSKPISRLRLFITKYLTGLVFVALQVTLICGLGYLILGIRGGGWYPSLFWGIPIVLAFFSYLFSVCVLMGIITRSPLPALTLTIVFWLVCFGISLTEVGLLSWKTGHELDLDRINLQIDTYDKRIAMMQPKTQPNSATTTPTTHPEPILLTDFKAARQRLLSERPKAEASLKNSKMWHQLVYPIKTLLPKTGETTGLLDRFLFTPEEDEAFLTAHEKKRDGKSTEAEIYIPEKNQDVELNRRLRDRSVTWIVGTSLLFELIVLTLAAFLFSRRDF